MSLIWGTQPTRGRTAYHDRLWKRADMAAWDERWHALSPGARGRFLNDFKIVRSAAMAPRQLYNRLSEAERSELIAGGFAVVVHKPIRGEEMHGAEAAAPFATRLRALNRHHLLASSEGLSKYVSHTMDGYAFEGVIAAVVKNAIGLAIHELPRDPLGMLARGPRWAGWVAGHLGLRLAGPILAAIREAGGRWPLARLAGLAPGADVAEIRREIDALVNHLALVEDLDPVTHEIVVGFLPEVRAAWAREAGRPSGLRRVTPASTLAEDGITAPDMRAALLELSCGPAQLRQDGSLFAKEEDRFLGCLAPLPPQFDPQPHVGERINSALREASRLGLLRRQRKGGKEQLDLAPQGAEWMAASPDAQLLDLYKLAGRVARRRPSDWYDYHSAGDVEFLGAQLAVTVKTSATRDDLDFARAYNADPLPLRAALRSALESLPVGEFHALDSVLAHLAAPERNPLLLGRTPAEVAIYDRGRRVPPLDEAVEAAGRDFLAAFIVNRMIPLGGLRLGWSADGERAVARLPRMSWYFDPDAVKPARAEAAPARVVVQPDFSVILIGLNPGPAAAIASFAARDREASSLGSMTFRLTREDALRAVQAGLTGDEMVARLRRHASTPVPANVEAQLLTWAGQARLATSAHMLVLRCPDEETAGRAMAALGKKAERLGPTCVGLPDGKLPAALRNKLAAQGVLLREATEED